MNVEKLLLTGNDWVPNNQRFAVRLYRGAVAPGIGDVTSWFEHMFEAHSWPPQWRNGIYSYHHYHSTAHEVLGFASGSAKVLLGGPGGRAFEISAGDALLLPAGTGHCLLQATHEFLVVGAYPRGEDFDICRTAPTSQMSSNIAGLRMPDADPVTGDSFDQVYWRESHKPEPCASSDRFTAATLEDKPNRRFQ